MSRNSSSSGLAKNNPTVVRATFIGFHSYVDVSFNSIFRFKILSAFGILPISMSDDIMTGASNIRFGGSPSTSISWWSMAARSSLSRSRASRCCGACTGRLALLLETNAAAIPTKFPFRYKLFDCFLRVNPPTPKMKRLVQDPKLGNAATVSGTGIRNFLVY